MVSAPPSRCSSAANFRRRTLIGFEAPKISKPGRCALASPDANVADILIREVLAIPYKPGFGGYQHAPRMGAWNRAGGQRGLSLVGIDSSVRRWPDNYQIAARRPLGWHHLQPKPPYYDKAVQLT
jgi:hypothetical protein